MFLDSIKSSLSIETDVLEPAAPVVGTVTVVSSGYCVSLIGSKGVVHIA